MQYGTYFRSIPLAKKFALISSTGASVVRNVYENSLRTNFDLHLVITDRVCGASEFAKENGIPHIQVNADDVSSLSIKIENALILHGITYAYLFFTRLLRGNILKSYKNKIINFHPSLLPACPGLHGFEDTLRSGALLAGSTVHFIDDGMDTGDQIIQTFTPTIGLDTLRLRHIIFAQQCAALYDIHRELQVANDLSAMRLRDCQLAQGFCPNINDESLQLYRSFFSSGSSLNAGVEEFS